MSNDEKSFQIMSDCFSAYFLQGACLANFPAGIFLVSTHFIHFNSIFSREKKMYFTYEMRNMVTDVK